MHVVRDSGQIAPGPIGSGSTAFLGISPAAKDTLIVAIVFPCLGLLCVALRVFLRLRDSRSLSRDDWTIIAGFIACLGLSILECMGSVYGAFGWNIFVISKAQLNVSIKIFFAISIVYPMAQLLVKTSVLLLYMRIFNVRKFRKAAYAVMSLCIAWSISTVLVQIFQCRPIRGAWSLHPRPPAILYKCASPRMISLASGISNLLLDVIILCLPIPMIWNLKLDTKRKIAINAIFLTGSIACLGSILRITSITNVKAGNITINCAPFCTWTTIEVNLAVIAACLPTFRPLFYPPGRQSGSRPSQNSDDSELARLSNNAHGMGSSTGSSRKVPDPYSTDVDDSVWKGPSAATTARQRQDFESKDAAETKYEELSSDTASTWTEGTVSAHSRGLQGAEAPWSSLPDPNRRDAQHGVVAEGHGVVDTTEISVESTVRSSPPCP